MNLSLLVLASQVPGSRMGKEAMAARIPLPVSFYFHYRCYGLRACHSTLSIQCLSSSGQLNRQSNQSPSKVLRCPKERAIKPNGCHILKSLSCARDCAKLLTFTILLNPRGPMSWLLLPSSFYKCRNRDPESTSNTPDGRLLCGSLEI